VKSFSALLSEFVERAGIPDADLARRMGVSRQTVFRWREGTTRAPRRREDMLTLASLLRLDPEERDVLLLSAGFAPVSEGAAPLGPPGEHPRSSAIGPPQTQRSRSLLSVVQARLASLAPWQLAGGLLAALLAITGVILFVRLVMSSLAIAGGEGRPQPALPGETLVLVSEFANYSGAQTGFNVAGRLREALRVALLSAGLDDVRVDLWPETIVDQDTATQRAEEVGATVVVWGEYDSGRVVARVSAYPSGLSIQGGEHRWLLAEPSQLNTTVNSDLPEDVQWMALYVLGQVDYWTHRPDQAEAAFRQALAFPPEDPAAIATAHVYLAVLEATKSEPDWDRVVAWYTEALDIQSDSTGALNNRGVAYLSRNAPGDLGRAEADLRAALSLDPSFAPAPFNLALALLRNPSGNAEEALRLLKTAESLDPLAPGVQNALCWTLSLEGRPAEALSHCDEAVRRDETGNSHDSRGLALALLGRFQEAIEEFERFLELSKEGAPQDYARHAQTRESWIETLQHGENPFDASTLERLRSEDP
jgi:tetratricopeptide (TPR) repeat protein/transcriptional regulator with XRE-family HTH domain